MSLFVSLTPSHLSFVEKHTCDVGMELQESLQRDVGRKSLDAVVGHAVFRPTLRTLDLPLDVVHEALHAGLEAVVVLAGQHLGCPVPVQADTAGEQLVELLHPAGRRCGTPAASKVRNPLLGCVWKNRSFIATIVLCVSLDTSLSLLSFYLWTETQVWTSYLSPV